MSSPNPNDPAWAEEVANQAFNLTDVTGSIDPFTLSELDYFFHWNGRSLIIFGVDIGMVVTLAIVLLLLTKPEKRRTQIFALNISGLALHFIRMICVCVLYNGPTKTIGVFFLNTNAMLGQIVFVPAYIYIVATIFWTAVILASLVLQVRVVFGAEPTARQYVTMACGVLALATVAIATTAQAYQFQAALGAGGADSTAFNRIQVADHILFATTVGITSGIFVGKLLYLIYRRRKMGFRSFGPLQVILIMGTQCLLVPRTVLYSCCLPLVAFMIANFYVDIDGFTTIGETFLTCSVPLSALWASAEGEKSSVVQVKPSFGNYSGTTSSTNTEGRPMSKKHFFGIFQGGKGTQSSVHSEVEKGSFTEESDHVMIQRTLQVVTAESPVPRSAGNGSYRF
jgi:pheromone alpha factor receptor